MKEKIMNDLLTFAKNNDLYFGYKDFEDGGTEVIFGDPNGKISIIEIHWIDIVFDEWPGTFNEIIGAIENDLGIKFRHMPNPRPSKDEYYLTIAQAVAKRSTCLRRQYGAVIVKDDRIISTGYNGSARGSENCCDCGTCYRERNNIPHGEQYEKCESVHAEANAIINGNPSDMIGATLYLAGFENWELMKDPKPCMMCERLIKNARIEKVINNF